MKLRYVPDTDRRYSISDDGKVFSHYHRYGRREEPKEMKPTPDSSGYLQVDIYLNGKQKKRKIHSLVAETFLGPRPAGYDTDHADGNRTNNHVSNLSYRSRSENNQNQKNSKNYHFHKQRQKWVVQFRVDGKYKSFGYFNTEQEAKTRAAELRLELDWYCPSKQP